MTKGQNILLSCMLLHLTEDIVYRIRVYAHTCLSQDLSRRRFLRLFCEGGEPRHLLLALNSMNLAAINAILILHLLVRLGDGAIELHVPSPLRLDAQ